MSQTDSKVPRRSSVMDTEDGTITIGEHTFALGALPAATHAGLALRGLRQLLLNDDDPAALFAGLAAGDALPGRKAKAEKTDPWRDAWAHAVAEGRARKLGIKLKAPEYGTILAAAREDADKLGRAELAKARRMPGVMAHHARLTGAVFDPEALIGGDAATEEAAPLADAA